MAKGGNSKKEAGNAKKAEAAAKKAAVEQSKKDAELDQQWNAGAQKGGKKEAEAAKKAEAAQKKAERDRLLQEEEASLPTKKGGNSKKAQPKKARGIDSALDDPFGDEPAGNKKLATLNATGIDNALDALGLDDDKVDKNDIDRHPEKRVREAYREFEEMRLKEMDEDGTGKGLRRSAKINRLRKEFEKSPLNPLNRATIAYNASKTDIADVAKAQKDRIENTLAEE